jgi:hypothetical protein
MYLCIHLRERIFLNTSSLVQEGIYLFNHDIDPYSGGSFRHVRLFYCRTVSTRLPSGLVTSFVVLLRDPSTQFKKVGIDFVDCKRCCWCMGFGTDFESSSKREKQPTRCPRRRIVSWLFKHYVYTSNPLQILIESLFISSFACVVHLFI